MPSLPLIRLACTGPATYPCPEALLVPPEVFGKTADLAATLKRVGWKVSLVRVDGDDALLPLCPVCAEVVMADVAGTLAVA